MGDETYNGWTNRETWAANLWLSNDEGLECLALERVAAVGPNPYSEAGDQRTASEVGAALVELVDELCYGDGELGPVEGMARDVGSVWRIDEVELGRAWLESFRELVESGEWEWDDMSHTLDDDEG